MDGLLLVITGISGILCAISGIWLLLHGKAIERKIAKDYTTWLGFLFQNNWTAYASFGLWERHSTRPLAISLVIISVLLLVIMVQNLLIMYGS